MNLREIAKKTLAMIKPEMTVQFGELVISGPLEDRGFLNALQKNQREPFMVATLLDHITAGAVFLDVGAHLGQYSLAAAAKMNGFRAGETHVFEPHPRSFKFLAKNILRNGLEDRIQLNNACASDQQGTVTLYVDDLQSDFTSLIPQADGSSRRKAVEVPAITLDGYFRDKQLPTVVKIDVEGAEMRVLSGMEDLIRRNHPTLFIESNATALRKANSSPRELFHWLSERYDSIHVIDEEEQTLKLLADANSINDACVNLLCKNGIATP